MNNKWTIYIDEHPAESILSVYKNKDQQVLGETHKDFNSAIQSLVRNVDEADDKKCNGNCGMNYCDEYGCIENKPEGDVSHLLVKPTPISNGDESDGWLSVDSAPKDGSDILGYDPNTETNYIAWCNKTMGNGCWNCLSNSYIQKISHWQLLPKAPISQSSVQSSDEKNCDAMGHYGGDPKPGGICQKCGKNFTSSDEASSGVSIKEWKEGELQETYDRIKKDMDRLAELEIEIVHLRKCHTAALKLAASNAKELWAQSYPRWVKASERLPEPFKNKCVKTPFTPDDDLENCKVGYYSSTGNEWYVYTLDTPDFETIIFKSEQIEWWEETPFNQYPVL